VKCLILVCQFVAVLVLYLLAVVVTNISLRGNMALRMNYPYVCLLLCLSLWARQQKKQEKVQKKPL
jgi:hypothetical protein